MELFHTIQTIAAKIKASGSLKLLENYEEYVALVMRHLPKEIAWKWCQKDLSGWSSFFNFLEKEAKVAKKMITNEAINSALSGELINLKSVLCVTRVILESVRRQRLQL